MGEDIISEIYLIGTSTPTEISSSTPVVNYEYKISVPFLDFLGVAIVFFAAFLVFKLFFKGIWTD